MAQQTAVESAFEAFQDRYHALPGDYAGARIALKCGETACPDGNGNGRIESGASSLLREDILAWQHLTPSGFWSLLRSWLRPHRGISPEKLPLYLGFFEFVHNVRRRGGDGSWRESLHPLPVERMPARGQPGPQRQQDLGADPSPIDDAIRFFLRAEASPGIDVAAS